MDENLTPEELSGDNWLEEFLAAKEAEQEPAPEIQVDETAVFAAGLTNPEDLELERIMSEVNQGLYDNEDDDVKEYHPGEPIVHRQESVTEIIPAQTAEEPAPAENEEEQEEQPVEKGRPKKKKDYRLFGLPHLAVTCIWLAIIVVIGVTVGRLVWLCASDVLAFGREPKTAEITINEGDDLDTIAKKLKDAGLIKYPGLFKIYAKITDADQKIKPGTYDFTAQSKEGETIVYDYMALVTVLSPHSSSQVVIEDLRIPEGATCSQIFAILEKNKVCTVAEMEHFLTATRTEGENLTDAQKADNALVDKRTELFSDYDFLKDEKLEGKYALEGYLFPDTYDFYQNDDPARVLEKMLNAFDTAFTNKMKDDWVKLNERLEEMMRKNGYGSDYIEQHRVSVRDVVIIASMIEKESANNAESFVVSSVIYNRLTKANKFPYLNIDATLLYYLDKQPGEGLTTEELQDASNPYNTYKHRGLPPGPISNPSQNSLAAALDPEDTDYYWYAFNPETRKHEFFKENEQDKFNDFVASLKEKA